MTSFLTRSSAEESPSLPTHSTPQENKISKKDHEIYLKARYEEANLKLSRLEEELDVLLYCGDALRERRTELTQGRMSFCVDSFPHKRNIEGGADVLLNTYLELARKSKALDEVIKALKEECTAARSDCTSLFVKFRRCASAGFKEFKNERALHKDTYTGVDGWLSRQQFMSMDDLGSMDKETRAERMMEMQRSATNVGAVVGALGVGVTFSTLFSATRGRLDLIAWAFACFVATLFSSALLQCFIQPRRHEVRSWARSTFLAQRSLLLYRVAVLAFPSIAGMVLLALAVALVDGQSVSPGPQEVFRLAGCFPLAWISVCVAIAFFFAKMRGLLSHRPTDIPFPTSDKPTENMEKRIPSHILPVDYRWWYLPGGPDYFTYRKWRHNHQRI